MDDLLFKVFGWLAIALVALFAGIEAADNGFAIHMGIVVFAALLTAWVTMQRADYAVLSGLAPAVVADRSRYEDDVIRLGVLATLFWGIVGFLVGVIIASQLVFPDLNLGQYVNFGRLRPVHTSAVIFAFGGNALIATSFYVVQRTCRARLAFPAAAKFVFWGYQLFIVLADSQGTRQLLNGRPR